MDAFVIGDGSDCSCSTVDDEEGLLLQFADDGPSGLRAITHRQIQQLLDSDDTLFSIENAGWPSIPLRPQSWDCNSKRKLEHKLFVAKSASHGCVCLYRFAFLPFLIWT